MLLVQVGSLWVLGFFWFGFWGVFFAFVSFLMSPFPIPFPFSVPVALLAFNPSISLLPPPPLHSSSPAYTFGFICSRLSPTQTQSVIQLSAFLAHAHPGININRN